MKLPNTSNLGPKLFNLLQVSKDLKRLGNRNGAVKIFLKGSSEKKKYIVLYLSCYQDQETMRSLLILGLIHPHTSTSDLLSSCFYFSFHNMFCISLTNIILFNRNNAFLFILQVQNKERTKMF